MAAIDALWQRLDAICVEHEVEAEITIECATEAMWSARVIVTPKGQHGLVDMAHSVTAVGEQTPEQAAVAAVENAIEWVMKYAHDS